jgi:hypothetical protein
MHWRAGVSTTEKKHFIMLHFNTSLMGTMWSWCINRKKNTAVKRYITELVYQLQKKTFNYATFLN